MRALSGISWTFGGTEYPTREAFAKAVADYQVLIHGDDNDWKPESVVIDAPEIEVCYEHWFTPNMAEFSDERPANDDGGEQLETIMRIASPDGNALTANEVLYQLHARMRHRELGDHRFFEGLNPHNAKRAKPLFFLRCGS